MPRQGETFINAIGVEVVAHGGATPMAPAVQVANGPDQPINTEVSTDVFGRVYDPSVPVFIPTGTNLVFDRLAMMGNSKGGSTGSLLDIDSLSKLAEEKGHAWGGNEIGMPPQEWLDGNGPFSFPIQPGFGTGTPPTLPTPPSGTQYSWRAEFDKNYYESAAPNTVPIDSAPDIDYSANGHEPVIVGDFENDTFKIGTTAKTFTEVFDYTGTPAYNSLGIILDSAADTLTISAAALNDAFGGITPTAIAVSMFGTADYTDNLQDTEIEFYKWGSDGLNYLLTRLISSVPGGHYLRFEKVNGGAIVAVSSPQGVMAQGTQTPFGIATRQSADTMNGAFAGTAYGANGSAIAVPALVEPFGVGTKFKGTVARIVIWNVDIDDLGIIEASGPFPTPIGGSP